MTSFGRKTLVAAVLPIAGILMSAFVARAAEPAGARHTSTIHVDAFALPAAKVTELVLAAGCQRVKEFKARQEGGWSGVTTCGGVLSLITVSAEGRIEIIPSP